MTSFLQPVINRLASATVKLIFSNNNPDPTENHLWFIAQRTAKAADKLASQPAPFPPAVATITAPVITTPEILSTEPTAEEFSSVHHAYIAQGQILVAQYKDTALVDIFGGKREEQQSFIHTLSKEVFEELGVPVSLPHVVHLHNHKGAYLTASFLRAPFHLPENYTRDLFHHYRWVPLVDLISGAIQSRIPFRALATLTPFILGVPNGYPQLNHQHALGMTMHLYLMQNHQHIPGCDSALVKSVLHPYMTNFFPEHIQKKRRFEGSA